MDGESHSSLWTKFSSLFSGKNEDHLEQAILEARADGELKAEEGSMLLSILTLDELQVQDIMTPRTDIDCVPTGTPIVEAAKAIGDTGHSRLPIYQDTRDNIIGIVYAKDMLAYLIQPESHNEPVDTIMRPPFFVPETKISSELLQEFRSRKNHLAIVVDEYGGTSGLATIEDLLEVIVGDIEDEHDAPKEDDIRPLPDGGYELSGRAYLEDLEPLGMIFESDEVDTIGGYLSLGAGHVPQQGEEFTLDGWTFTVADADAKQIHKVRVRRADAAPAADAD
ncbi:MAG: magnesium/cobalt efflux protein [Desulfovibrionaceae bacterium]|nr:HlyC/CorC family transporter [Desulfovibrionaceae bacterium]PWM68028.1 MAG: magnesium/cobalt efflux protein [Desulfovibrionaceae bacterium]